MPRKRPRARKTTKNNPQTELPVGRIAGIFGVRGELKCDPSNAGGIAFSVGAELRCERRDGSSLVRVASVRPHKGRLLIRLAGVDDADAAQSYAGATLYAPREQLDVGSDEFLDVDLVGCGVFGLDGRAYGTVDDVQHYPASDMLVVGGRMVPMVRAIVREIDVRAKRIVVDPPAGLLDDD